jgi:hypothetical protein
MQNNEFMGKDENIAFRTSAETKQLLERLAKEGYRSLSQQCEMIITQWLKQHGYTENEEEPLYEGSVTEGAQAGAMVQEPPGKYGRKRGK